MNSSDMDGGGQLKRASQTNLDLYQLPMIQKKIVQRSCKGPVSVKRVDPKGDYIVIENTCIKKPIVLTNWTLKRRGVDVPANTFKFEKHFVLHPNKSVKIYAKDKGKNNPPHELMSDTITNWGVGTYAFTALYNHLNQEKASLLEKVEHYEREIQVNVTKSTEDRHSMSNLDFDYLDASVGAGGAISAAAGTGRPGSYNRDFEFYFERKIRP